MQPSLTTARRTMPGLIRPQKRFYRASREVRKMAILRNWGIAKECQAVGVGIADVEPRVLERVVMRSVEGSLAMEERSTGVKLGKEREMAGAREHSLILCHVDPHEHQARRLLVDNRHLLNDTNHQGAKQTSQLKSMTTQD